MKQIFISSVQKEFERERAAIKKMIEACLGGGFWSFPHCHLATKR